MLENFHHKEMQICTHILSNVIFVIEKLWCALLLSPETEKCNSARRAEGFCACFGLLHRSIGWQLFCGTRQQEADIFWQAAEWFYDSSVVAKADKLKSRRIPSEWFHLWPNVPNLRMHEGIFSLLRTVFISSSHHFVLGDCLIITYG